MICSFKKPGAPAFGRHTSGLEVLLTTQEGKTILLQMCFYTEIYNNEFFANMKCHVYGSYVTGFGKIQLPRTQQQTHFHHHMIAIHIN